MVYLKEKIPIKEVRNMVMITWSPRLIHAVKEIKRLDKHKVVSLFNDRKYMDSLLLSNAEEQAMSSVITKNTTIVSTNAYWM
jgi:hypothetical protein